MTVDLTKIPTADLVKELRTRKLIRYVQVSAGEAYIADRFDDYVRDQTITGVGPAQILVIHHV